nr:SCO2322 family protein [Streptomyces sp. TS71-3]
MLVLALLGALVAGTLAGAGPAGAAGYRYWSFWELSGGGWVYATQGPSVERPADGDVQGFRFAVSEDSQDATQPRGAHDFAAICKGTPARPGTKRVALVIDPGTAADAPAGETPPEPRTACARLSPDATSADGLAAVARPLRYDSHALLCAIAGYPRSGCGEQVSVSRPAGGASAHPSAAGDASSGGRHIPSAGVVVGIAVVALLGVAAIWQSRRRRG